MKRDKVKALPSDALHAEAYKSDTSLSETARFELDALRSMLGIKITPRPSRQCEVELISFETQTDGQDVLLQWSTASETNNAGFNVEHKTSRDNASAERTEEAWQTLAWIEGPGTTEQAQRYQFRAASLPPGRHVFRLKQIDYDGTFGYSPEVEVGLEVVDPFLLTSPYPNPFNPQTSFSLAVPVMQAVSVEVYNLLGRRMAVLYKGQMQANQARAFVWDAASHPSGLYFIRVVGERFAETHRVTLLK